MREKIAYIGHSYHVKTKSTEFLINYLKEFYEVEVFADTSWEDGGAFDYSFINDSYKAIVFFQLFPEKEVFKKIKHNNIIFFPMYDGVAGWDVKKWKAYKKTKIINFSSTLHKRLLNWNFNSIYAQYFPEPQEFSPGNIDEIFFWQRINNININTVKTLIGDFDCKIHMHKAIDPFNGFIQPSKEDEEKYKITYSQWFDTKEEMQNLIKTKGIYIAPRIAEGIGMSFLEAMAQGKAVIANDEPTMNEYVINGENGYLFDYKNPQPINLKEVTKIQENAYRYIQTGYENWLNERSKIIDFIMPKKIKLSYSFWPLRILENTQIKNW